MSIYLIERPSVTISGSGFLSKRSRWNAVHNPIRLTFQRKDIQNGFVYLPATGNVSGKLKVYWANATNINQSLTAGQKVFVGGPSYGKQATILIANGNSITLDIAFVDNLGPRFLNFITFNASHFAQIELWDSEKNISYGTWEGSSDSNGIIRADISGLLKKNLEAIDESLFDLPNRKADKSYGKIQFKYRDFVLLGFTPWRNGGDVFYWTNSAKQIQEKHSGNMAQYVPVNDSNLPEEKKMKFLIEGRPTYFVGYPFDLYWIYPEGFNNNIIQRRQQNKTHGGAPTSALQFTDLSYSQRVGVNTLMPGNIDANATYFEVWLEQGDAVPTDGYVSVDFTDKDFTRYDAIARRIDG